MQLLFMNSEQKERGGCVKGKKLPLPETFRQGQSDKRLNLPHIR
jgi:hypothetical protein